MKNYKFLILTFWICFLSVEAQIKVTSEVDLTDYPEISFDLNNRNPEFKGKSNYSFFKISGQEKKLIDSITIQKINDSIDYSKKNKCVLILVESINHFQRKEQVNTFFRALEGSLSEFINSGDKIKIAVFHLRKESLNNKTLKPLHESFTDNIDVLKKAIANYDASSEIKGKAVSEIPGAISEGIDMLVDLPYSFNKSILLLSDERTNNYSTQKTFVNVIDQAKDKEIVINTIKYNSLNYSQHTNPVMASRTYGESHILSKSRSFLRGTNKKKLIEAETKIISILKNVVKRSNGTTSKAKIFLKNAYKDGINNKIKIKELNSPFEFELNFKAPGNWYYAQFEKKPIRTTVITLILFVFIAISVKKIRGIRNLNKLKLLKEKEEQRKIQINQEDEILKQKKEIESMKIIEKERLDKIKYNKLLEEEKQLIQKMKLIGNFPIVKFSDSKNENTFEINKPVMTFGRDQTNDFCIPNPNISRKHFTIKFESSNYLILDNNSLNGMIVNGFKIKKSILKNNDVIEIADAKFIFYL